MSAGPFVLTAYEADYGTGANIHPIRVQPETEALTINGQGNDGPATTAITNPISATVSKSRRGLGLHPRMVTIRFTGTLPPEYAAGRTYRVPLLNRDIPVEARRGATGTYLNQAIVVVNNYAPEIVR